MAFANNEKQESDVPLYLDDVTLSVPSTRVLKTANDLDTQMKSQLSFLIKNPNCWWLDSIESCFNKRQVDDGLLLYKKMICPQLTLYYWVGYFGGNPRGYVLIPTSSTTNDDWKILIENCDSDFIWRGEGAAPKAFMKQVKMAAYGDKHREDDDD